MTNADRNPKVEYLIFDIETIADGDLVAKIRFPNEGLLPEEAIARYRATLLAETGRDVFPVTFMLPISVAAAIAGCAHGSHSTSAASRGRLRPCHQAIFP